MSRAALLLPALLAAVGCTTEESQRAFALNTSHSHDCGEGYIVFVRDGAIHRMRADGTDLVQLTDDPAGMDAWPRWSPDGGRIAFLRAGDLWTMDARGAGATMVLPGASVDGEFGRIAWSPDAVHIAISLRSGNFPVAIYDVESARFIYAGDIHMADVAPSIAWSPAGDNLVHAIRVGAGTDLRTVGPDGILGPTLFSVSGEINGIAWSPDGNYIAVLRSAPGDSRSVSMFDLDGTPLGVVPFTPTSGPFGAFWSPDSGCLGVEYTSYSSLRSEIVVRDLSGGGETVFEGYMGDWVREIAVPPDAPPVASFTATPETAAVGEWVAFDPSASTDDLGIVEYVLDFDGDGIGDLTEPTPVPAQWKYDVPGSYAVELRVRDTAGQWGTATRTVTVATPEKTVTLTIAFPNGVTSSVIVNVDGVDVQTCTATCTVETPPGATVTLTAGGDFYGWSDCDAVVGGVCTLTMNSDRTVTLKAPL